MKATVTGILMDIVKTKKEGYVAVYLYQKGNPSLVKVTQCPKEEVSDYETGEEITLDVILSTFTNEGKTIHYIKYEKKGD